MTSYFEAINNGNSLLIDDTYSNYVLFTKGKVTTSSAPAIPVQAVVQLPVITEGYYPIVALVHAGYVNILANIKKGDGSFEVTFLLSDQDSTIGTELEWFAFIPSDSPEATLKQTGLFCLWDVNGKPVFDSNANYMRVVDLIMAPYPNSVNKSYLSTRKYAVVVAVNQLYVKNQSGSPGGWGSVAGMSARMSSNGSLSVKYQLLRDTILGEPNYMSNRNDTGVFMIVDVTGY